MRKFILTQHLTTMKRSLFFLLLLILAGCSQNIKITGKVQFDDGEPVSFGAVVFETSKNSFTGKLDQQGHYAVGDTGDGAGIPPGDYTVWLSGTALQRVSAAKGNKGDGENEGFESEETPRVHPKHTSPQSPDALKFTVKSDGGKTFNFIVQRPPAAKR